MKAEFLAHDLNSAETSVEQRKVLILMVEQSELINLDLRFKVAQGLAVSALELNVAKDSAYIWEALRRIGTLISHEQVDVLLPFLDSSSASVRQAALQAIRQLFERTMPTSCAAVDRLKQRLQLLITKDYGSSPAERSLLANVLLAGVALQLEVEIPAWLSKRAS